MSVNGAKPDPWASSPIEASPWAQESPLKRHRLAAVHVDDGTVEPAAAGREDESGEARDVLGLADADAAVCAAEALLGRGLAEAPRPP